MACCLPPGLSVKASCGTASHCCHVAVQWLFSKFRFHHSKSPACISAPQGMMWACKKDPANLTRCTETVGPKLSKLYTQAQCRTNSTAKAKMQFLPSTKKCFAQPSTGQNKYIAELKIFCNVLLQCSPMLIYTYIYIYIYICIHIFHFNI